MNAGKLLTVGAVGIAGWWLYSNWQTLFGTTAALPAAAPAPGGIIPASTPMPTTTTATSPAPAPAPQTALMDPATLIAKLKAANSAATLTQDQWNYYRNQIEPPALTGEQLASAFPVAGGPVQVSADDFVAQLHSVGLAAYRPRTMTRARRINYRRAAA